MKDHVEKRTGMSPVRLLYIAQLYDHSMSQDR
jgi:hypothetical protein